MITLPYRELGALALTATLVACGDDEPAKTDAPGPCWPLPSQPGGEVEMGTGDVDWQPMPDVLTITKNASQSDPFLQIHSRIRGMPPGDPQDAFDPTNPRTKVSAFIPDLGLTLGVDCPASLGYKPAPGLDDTFDMLRSLRIGFGTMPLEMVSGKQVRLTIEVVGSNQLYATAEKTVMLEMVMTGADAGADAASATANAQ